MHATVEELLQQLGLDVRGKPHTPWSPQVCVYECAFCLYACVLLSLMCDVCVFVCL